ncbi:MAG: hypothetical protein JW894_10790 [Bacteroidales bacterium]|nr:hypothetical protein [Bacteroidales bacterium]
MASKKIPKIHKTSYTALIPQFAILLIIAFIFYLLQVPRYAIMSVAIYLLLSFYLKILIPRWHRKGIFYLKKGELEASVYAFKKSFIFFTRYQWIDKYRAFTLFSISSLSYTEMALMNIIFCYNQMGDNKKAEEHRKILKEIFPKNPYI